MAKAPAEPYQSTGEMRYRRANRQVKEATPPMNRGSFESLLTSTAEHAVTVAQCESMSVPLGYNFPVGMVLMLQFRSAQIGNHQRFSSHGITVNDRRACSTRTVTGTQLLLEEVRTLPERGAVGHGAR